MSEAKKKAPEKRDEEIEIDGHSLALSNLDKVLFPDDGYTKGEVIDFYQRIAEVALPYYRERPLSMHRFPDGIDAEGFFQKNLPEHFPDWIDRVELPKEDGTVTYMVADSAASLAYIANQGCITPHLALARRDKPDHPDRLILDLDPPGDGDFALVQKGAAWTREILDELGLPSFVMTTGSRGLHVVVPLDRSAAFEAARDFAGDLADLLAARHPDHLTVAQRKDKRGNRLFLDTLRNAYGQTAVAPYALRARPGAPVATPLTWEEALAAERGPQDYTLKNIFRRLAQTDDPWSGIEGRSIAVKDAAQRLSELS
jgi:bifunctional non-homologous end joining protein LigD